MLDRRLCVMVVVVAVGVAAVATAARRLGLRAASTTSTDALASLWVGGIETMLDVPGAGTTSLAPCGTRAAQKRARRPWALLRFLRRRRQHANAAKSIAS